MVNGVSSAEDKPAVINSLPLVDSSIVAPISRQRSKRCSLIKEEFSEEDEHEFTGNGFGFDEVKECHSANVLSSNDDTICVQGKSLPASPSTAVATTPRLLKTVHSMPQLMLNQISEEDEDEDEQMSSSFSAYPPHQPSFSIASAGNFGGCARKANRKSSTKTVTSVQLGTDSAPNLSHKSGHKKEKDLHSIAMKEMVTDGGVTVEADGGPWAAVVGKRRSSCNSNDDEDDLSVRVGHFCLQHEPIRQHSLVQSTSDMEGFGNDHTDLSVLYGTTNSLDRRLFPHARKDGKSTAGRSIVGAVKKSVGVLLGHLSAVGDATSVKPRSIETWSSCSDLMQASAQLRCTDSTFVNLADRDRVARCQFARELRQNRSQREAQFDTNKSQSTSSHVIRVRSRNFDALVSKFTSGDQTTANSIKTDAS